MIVADFRREYGITAREMYDMPTLEFLWLLNGLSEESNWVKQNQEKKNRRASKRGRR